MYRSENKKGDVVWWGPKWQLVAVFAAGVVGWRLCNVIDHIFGPPEQCSTTVVAPQRSSRQLDWLERR